MTNQLTAHDVSYEQVAQMIDHSLLRPELTLDEVHFDYSQYRYKAVVPHWLTALALVAALALVVVLAFVVRAVFRLRSGQHARGTLDVVPLLEGQQSSVRELALSGVWGREIHVLDSSRCLTLGGSTSRVTQM